MKTYWHMARSCACVSQALTKTPEDILAGLYAL